MKFLPSFFQEATRIPCTPETPMAYSNKEKQWKVFSTYCIYRWGMF